MLVVCNEITIVPWTIIQVTRCYCKCYKIDALCTIYGPIVTLSPPGETALRPKPVALPPFEELLPYPGKLVGKIQLLQFVDMLEITWRLATLPQMMQLHTIGQREVSSITSWACAFTTYTAILAQTSPDLVVGRLAYLRNIMREAYRLGGDGWRTYDYVSHNQAAADCSMD